VLHFKLELALLEDKEVDSIFELVIGEEEEEDLFALTFKEIQSFYLVFISSIEDEEIKDMLNNLIDEISMINGKTSIDELIIYNTYTELRNSQHNYDAYKPFLKQIDEYRSNNIYSRHTKHTCGFNKKLKKALATYGYGLTEDDVIALYDSTFFGGADEGFLITKLGILTTQDEDYSVIPFASIYDVTYDKYAMRFFYKAAEGKELIEMASLPRLENLRILATILQQIADINITQNEKEEVK